MEADSQKFMIDSMKAAFSSGFTPASYALIMPIKYNDNIRRSYNVMKIRPINVTKDELYSWYNSTDQFSYTCGGTCLFAEKNESEEAFILRAATVGVMPEIRMIEDEDGKTIDIIDMETNVSFIKLRETAIKNKKGTK